MCDNIQVGPSGEATSSSILGSAENSCPGAAAATSAVATSRQAASNPVLEFRLKNGFCHGCGAQIYVIGEDGRISPLTIPGIVLQGRCLYCYPERQKTEPQKHCGGNELLKQHKRQSYDLEGCESAHVRKKPRLEQAAESTSSIQPETVASNADLPQRQTASNCAQRCSECEVCDLGDSDCFDDDEEFGNDLRGVEPHHEDRKGMRIRIRDHQKYVYVGRLIEGTRHKGKGVFRFLYRKGEHKGKEAEYEGEFEHGRMEGHGTSRDAAGCVYVGNFHRGAAHGKGTCTWSQQWEYDGDWIMDRREGRGTLRQLVEDGEVYSGDWKQDKWHGRGNLKFAGGGRYVGDFKHHKLDGNGRVSSAYSFLFANVLNVCHGGFG